MADVRITPVFTFLIDARHALEFYEDGICVHADNSRYGNSSIVSGRWSVSPDGKMMLPYQLVTLVNLEDVSDAYRQQVLEKAVAKILLEP